jgi:hypothetical protein
VSINSLNSSTIAEGLPCRRQPPPRLLRFTQPLRSDDGCLLSPDKTTPSQQVRTDLLLKH